MRILGRHDAHPRSTPRRQNRTAIDEQHAPRRCDPNRMEPLDTSWKYWSPTPSNPTPGGATTRRTSPPARQWPAGEMLPTMRHGVVAKTSNLDPTPTCRAGTEREKNRLIDELFIKDQQLQQVDTIIAELQDRIAQSKRNATRARPVKTRRNRPYKNRSWTTRPCFAKAKQELKNIRQQIADEKSSAQPCNCDYDQLLNNIVHEQVDVNRHRLLSTAKTMSHATATSTHRHTTTEPQTGRDSGPASPCLNTKPTTTPSQPAATESQPMSAPETADEFVQTPTSTRAKTTTSTPRLPQTS